MYWVIIVCWWIRQRRCGTRKLPLRNGRVWKRKMNSTWGRIPILYHVFSPYSIWECYLPIARTIRVPISPYRQQIAEIPTGVQPHDRKRVHVAQVLEQGCHLQPLPRSISCSHEGFWSGEGTLHPPDCPIRCDCHFSFVRSLLPEVPFQAAPWSHVLN